MPQRAEPTPPPVPRRWAGQAVVVVATGPSLTAADCAMVWSAQVAGRVRTIAVNDAYRLIRPDVLYACDHDWWNHHIAAVREWRIGECWTQDRKAAELHGLMHVPGWVDFAKAALGIDKPDGERRWEISTDARYIGFGGNSGFQAMNLAVHFGAARIVLLGFDMGRAPDGKRHFFGDHPKPLDRDSPYAQFVAAFDRAAPVLAAWGIDVVNASRRTALTCFPRLSLEEALAAPFNGGTALALRQAQGEGEVA